MKFENTLTSNWENAFRGLRNPMNSWEKSDSYGGLYTLFGDEGADAVYDWVKTAYPGIEEGSTEWCDAEEEYYAWFDKNAVIQINDVNVAELFFIGPKDMNLAQRMISGGRPNDKFLRQIFISVDITTPLYLWKEIDQYKVGTVTNSTSTMHKLASTPITLDCFETDDLTADFSILEANTDQQTLGHANFIQSIINYLEKLRQKYLETKDMKYWKELIRWLPESWLQTRTWTANYDVLRSIYHWRRDHRLTEWHQFCDWIKTLPYAEDLILYKN